MYHGHEFHGHRRDGRNAATWGSTNNVTSFSSGQVSASSSRKRAKCFCYDRGRHLLSKSSFRDSQLKCRRFYRSEWCFYNCWWDYSTSSFFVYAEIDNKMFCFQVDAGANISTFSEWFWWVINLYDNESSLDVIIQMQVIRVIKVWVANLKQMHDIRNCWKSGVRPILSKIGLSFENFNAIINWDAEFYVINKFPKIFQWRNFKSCTFVWNWNTKTLPQSFFQLDFAIWS